MSLCEKQELTSSDKKHFRRLIVRWDVDINQKGEYLPPIYFACMNGHENFVKLILDHKDFDGTDYRAELALEEFVLLEGLWLSSPEREEKFLSESYVRVIRTLINHPKIKEIPLTRRLLIIAYKNRNKSMLWRVLRSKAGQKKLPIHLNTIVTQAEEELKIKERAFETVRNIGIFCRKKDFSSVEKILDKDDFMTADFAKVCFGEVDTIYKKESKRDVAKMIVRTIADHERSGLEVVDSCFSFIFDDKKDNEYIYELIKNNEGRFAAFAREEVRKRMNTALHQLECDRMKEFLKNYPDIFPNHFYDDAPDGVRTGGKETLLYKACALNYDHPPLVKVFLEDQRIDVHKGRVEKNCDISPLYVACMVRKREVIRERERAGQKLSSLGKFSGMKKAQESTTPKKEICRVIKTLLNHPTIDVNKGITPLPGSKGSVAKSPFQCVIEEGLLGAAQVFLSHKKFTPTEDDIVSYITMAKKAYRKFNLVACRDIMEGSRGRDALHGIVSLFAYDKKYATPAITNACLSFFVETKYIYDIEYLMKRRKKLITSPEAIHQAISWSVQNLRCDLIYKLLQYEGVSYNKIFPGWNQTILYWLCDFVGGSKEYLLRTVKMLRKSKSVDINKGYVKGAHEASPLYAACKNGSYFIVAELLRHPDVKKALNVNDFLDLFPASKRGRGLWSLVMAALWRGDDNVAKELLVQSDFVTDKFKPVPEMICEAFCKGLSCLPKDRVDDAVASFLTWLCKYGDNKICRKVFLCLLEKHGADLGKAHLCPDLESFDWGRYPQHGYQEPLFNKVCSNKDYGFVLSFLNSKRANFTMKEVYKELRRLVTCKQLVTSYPRKYQKLGKETIISFLSDQIRFAENFLGACLLLFLIDLPDPSTAILVVQRSARFVGREKFRNVIDSVIASFYLNDKFNEVDSEVRAALVKKSSFANDFNKKDGSLHLSILRCVSIDSEAKLIYEKIKKIPGSGKEAFGVVLSRFLETCTNECTQDFLCACLRFLVLDQQNEKVLRLLLKKYGSSIPLEEVHNYIVTCSSAQVNENDKKEAIVAALMTHPEFVLTTFVRDLFASSSSGMSQDGMKMLYRIAEKELRKNKQ